MDKKIDTSGGAKNVVWSTSGGVKSITKAVTPAATNQSRNK